MKRSNLFWGLAIVLLGAVLLAINLGAVTNRIWAFFWPAIVILAGVWFLMRPSHHNPDAQAVTSNIPLENAASAEIDFNHGAGRLEINSDAQPGDLISGSFVGGVTADVSRMGETARVSLHTPGDLVFNGSWPTGGHGYEWKVGVTPEIPVTLRFHTGASESLLNMHGLKAKEILVETGASSSEMTMPAAAGNTTAKVKSGVASVKIDIPQGVGTKIHVHSGLSGINIDPSRFIREGDDYKSVDYATAVNKLDLDIETGVGSVEIH